MPQLNTKPWFFYLTITWLILLIVAPGKILGHVNFNHPKPWAPKKYSSLWTWPWQ